MAEVMEKLPAIEAVAEDLCGNDGVREIILRRMEVYPQPHREDWQWTIWWADYEDTLHAVPYVNLEAAFLAYVRDPASKKMPFPGQLLELSRTTPNEVVSALAFARRLDKMAQDRAARVDRPREPLTEEQKQAFHDSMAEYRERQAARKAAMEEARPKPGPVVHGPLVNGITPEMSRMMYGDPEPEDVDKWPT